MHTLKVFLREKAPTCTGSNSISAKGFFLLFGGRRVIVDLSLDGDVALWSSTCLSWLGALDTVSPPLNCASMAST